VSRLWRLTWTRFCRRNWAEVLSFLDNRSITLGQDFVPTLLNAASRMAVLLLRIWNNWLRTDGSGRRLINDLDDWVHGEIVEALAASVLVGTGTGR